MLTREQKEKLVEETAEKAKSAKAIVLTDFRALKVKDLTLLRKKLLGENASFKVIKKTLLERSFKKAGLEMNVKNLEGQIALSFSPDEVAAVKIIADFSKSNKNLKILGGIVSGQIMNSEQIKELAKLPNKKELTISFIRTIQSPLGGLTNVLAGNLRGLVQVLRAITENRQGQAAG